MKIAFYTLGCKVNQYETELIGENLSKSGYTVVSFSENPDVVLINSCTVTAESDRKSRQQIRKFKREHPNAIIVLTGCMPQADISCSAKLPETDVIVGNKNHLQIADAIQEFIEKGEQVVKVSAHEKDEKFEKCTISNFGEHTRAFVKIEDGCNRFCSYCIIPYARGRVRSKPVEDIIDEVSALSKNGYKEIVLVGINLSAYGNDFNDNLISPVTALAEKFPNLRIRLGSLEADLLTPEMIERLSAIKNLCPHFHLSLQSGCDKTLKRMNRKYNSANYAALVHTIRGKWDNASITADIIVGFAGEDENEFAESLQFAQKMAFSKIHIFPYSVRTGTKAETFPNQVDKATKSIRAKKMNEMAKFSEKNFLTAQIGTNAKVLFERIIDDMAVGYSENFTEIRVPFVGDMIGAICNASLYKLSESGEYIIGELI